MVTVAGGTGNEPRHRRRPWSVAGAGPARFRKFDELALTNVAAIKSRPLFDSGGRGASFLRHRHGGSNLLLLAVGCVSLAPVGFQFPACHMSSVANRNRKPAAYVWGKSSAPLDHDLEWTWSRAQLLRMDSRFRAAMACAVERGLERQPDGEAPKRAA